MENAKGESPSENQRGEAPVENNLRMPGESCSHAMTGSDGRRGSTGQLVNGTPDQRKLFSTIPVTCSLIASPGSREDSHNLE